MISAEVARAGCKYIGTPYSRLDCQAFVEKVLSDCGLKKNLAGSNAWYREVIHNGWVGSPEECKAQYGSIPPGAFLFILEQDGKEPSSYKGDGIGNASHIGIYTGLSGKQMCDLSGLSDASRYDFGDGAIHSSSSRGAVCTSTFKGKSISGGWNRVGLWNPVFKGGEITVMYQARVIGGGLNMRDAPTVSGKRIAQIPDGTIVTVTEEKENWSKTTYREKTGWVVSKYLERVVEGQSDFVSVPRSDLQEIYDLLGEWLRG